jgi:hypothetical protein
MRNRRKASTAERAIGTSACTNPWRALTELPLEVRSVSAWEFHVTAHDVSFDDEGQAIAPAPYFSLQISVLISQQRHNKKGKRGRE